MATAPTVQDTATTASGTGSFVNSISVSHTVAGGVTNPMLIAMATGFNQIPQSATWNGVPMNIGAYSGGLGGTVFYLANPATGSHTCTVSTAVVDRGQMLSVFLLQDCGSVVVNSTDTTGFLFTTSGTLNYTTTADDSLLLGMSWSHNGVTQTLGAGQTQISTQTAASAPTVPVLKTFSKLGAMHGSQSLQVSISSMDDLQIWGLAALPFGAGGLFIPQTIII